MDKNEYTNLWWKRKVENVSFSKERNICLISNLLHFLLSVTVWTGSVISLTTGGLLQVWKTESHLQSPIFILQSDRSHLDDSGSSIILSWYSAMSYSGQTVHTDTEFRSKLTIWLRGMSVFIDISETVTLFNVLRKWRNYETSGNFSSISLLTYFRVFPYHLSLLHRPYPQNVVLFLFYFKIVRFILLTVPHC